VTGTFRKAAYAAVELAEAEGRGLDDLVVVGAPPGAWTMPLREVKTMLRSDERRRMHERRRQRRS